MSHPAAEPNLDVPQQDFTVLLSIGRPTPDIGSAESEQGARRSDDGPEREESDEPQPVRHWIWQQSICAALHAIFVRGGSVIVRADGELLALLWGVASTHSSNGPGEEIGPRIHLLRDVNRTAEEDDVSSFSEAFAETGLVEIHGWTDEENELPGPGPHFGMILLPDANIPDSSLFRRTSANAVVRWSDEQAFDGPEARDVIFRGDAPAVAYLLESVVQEWVGSSQG